MHEPAASDEPQERKSTLWRWFRWPVFIYLMIIGIMVALERTLLFPAARANPATVDATVYGGEDVFFHSADGTKLHAWYFPAPDAAAPRGYLIYCHGNGDMVPRLGGHAILLQDLSGYAILAFDYRGYGLSEGKPEGVGILADARAARDWLVDRENIAPGQIVWMGRSLGGGVSVAMAAESGARGLILQNTFASLKSTAASHYPWLPVRWIMRTNFDSQSIIANYKGPLLQSHGTADRVIPFAHGRQLFDVANEPKEFVQLDGGHNSQEPAAYYETLSQFFDRLENTNPSQ